MSGYCGNTDFQTCSRDGRDGRDAQEKTEEKTEEQEKAESYAREIDTNQLKDWPQGPFVYADSAVIMDMESGAILYAKQPDKQHYPASITKLLTTLVALENANVTDKVRFTDDSISFLQWDNAQIGMKAGEELSLGDALYAILLASANEVSHAVAESVGTDRLGGDYQTFIDKMNTRAKELGCTNSHWINPNGLHDEHHYTTAHDMAVIASAVYQQPEFRKIMGTLEYKIGPTNLTKEDRVFQQNHKMLWPENYYYDKNVKGDKTGYTDQAKTTLVTMADNGKMQLAAVVMYDYGVTAYDDTEGMLNYVFQNFKKVRLSGQKNLQEIAAFEDKDASVTIPKNMDFSSLKKQLILTKQGIRSGKLEYTYKGQPVGSFDVTLTEDGYQKLAGGDAAKSDSKKIENKGSTPEDSKYEKEVKNKEVKSGVKNGVKQEWKQGKSNRTLKLAIAISAVFIFVSIVLITILGVIRKKKYKRK